MSAAGKLLGGVSSFAEKANPVIEGANGVKELCSTGEGGESNSAAPAGSTPDNAIQELLQSVMQALNGATGSTS